MRRILISGLVICFIIVFSIFFFDSPLYSRTAIIAGICLVLWLSENGPPFVPTFLLFALIPLLLGPLDSKYNLRGVMAWAADPVLALFLGGFVIGEATHRFGLDKRLANSILGLAGNSAIKILFFVGFVTAFLSMWMSNIAAAALMIASVRPLLSKVDQDSRLRRAILLSIAIGANFGGMATPIGTGPNAIAISSVSNAYTVTFTKWMFFAFPLTIGMLIAGLLIIAVRFGVFGNRNDGEIEIINGSQLIGDRPAISSGERLFLFICLSTIALWLSEPIHNIPASVVSLGAVSLLFLSGILSRDDLFSIDWSTLLLIAGGITLGKLLEQSGLVKLFADSIPWQNLDPSLILFLICFASALLSALMSNTATVVMLIPLAMALIPQPSTAILVAISASFGVPFSISTPPNAMVYGEGGIRSGDLFWHGIILMVTGCLITTLTGKFVLNLAGIP